MSDYFASEYKLEEVEKITTQNYGFDLFITPRYKHQYVNTAYERMTALLVRQNAKGVNSFIDIGAHYGFFDVLVGLSNPNCKIMAFEPVFENHEMLKKNLALNNINATTHRFAVSDQPGVAKFQLSKASDNSGLIANPAVGVIDTIDVELVKLDQYYTQLPDGPVLMKIDTEGNELKVLAGMQKIIESVRDLRLIIEFSPICLEANGANPQDLRDTLDQLGFDIFIIHEDERRYEKYGPSLHWNDFIGGKTHKNLFCIKKDKSLNLFSFSHSSALVGAERSLLEMVDNITSKQGAICTVALPTEGPLKLKLEELGVATMVINYHWWCAPTLPKSEEINQFMWESIKNLTRQISIIEKIAPDVVVTSTLVIPWGSICALLLNCPHIWWVQEYGEQDHGLEFYFTFQKTLDLIYESSNHVIVNSNSVKEALFTGREIDKLTVASYNVTLSESKNGVKLFFRYPNSLKLIITGTITKSKGQDDAVHAVKKLVERGYDVELSLLGDTRTPFGVRLKEFVRTEKLDDRIHFHGFVSNVRQAIEQADIGLTCSRNEAYGRVTAEVMLLGKPVIGTNTGGTVEIIDDGINGFVYHPNNIDELAEKIAFFMDYPEKVIEFGQQGKKSIYSKLSKRPVDFIIYQYCQEFKLGNNTNSEQLLRILTNWQKLAIDALSSKEQDLLEIRASQDWKLAMLFRRIRTRFLPSQSRREIFLNKLINSIAFLSHKNKKKLNSELALIRSSAFFDENWYLSNNPDVVQAKEDPANHYLLIGGFEGRDPSPHFDSSWYLSKYEDVRKAGVNPLVHYLLNGVKEEREPKIMGSNG